MMFDDKEKQEYMSVSVPKELKADLMNEFSSKTVYSRKNGYKQFRIAAVACAFCALIMFVGIRYLQNSSDMVKINILGNTASNEPMVARFVEDDTHRVIIPMWVVLEKKATIKVSEGRINIYDTKTKEAVYTGTEWKGKGTFLIQWEVDGNNISDYEITVSMHGKKKTYSLKCENKEWSLK